MPRMIRLFAPAGSSRPAPVLTEVSREEFDAKTHELEMECQKHTEALQAHLDNDDVQELADPIPEDTDEPEIEAEAETEDE